MNTKAKRATKQNFIYIIISVSIILIIYAIFQFALLLQKPTNSILVKKGRLTNYEEVVGYVIREEKMIDTAEFFGKRQMVIADASRVAKNGTIVSYISDNQGEFEEKIAKLDSEIQNIMETQQLTYSADVKNIESEVQEKLYALLTTKDLYEIIQIKKDINNNLEKKARIVGELSPTGSRLNTLIEERMGYEKKLNESKKDLKAKEPGLISYRVDGYENILTPTSFSKLTISELEKIKISINQLIPIDDEKIKTINNFYTYIAVPMKSEESKKLKLNDTVKISFNGDVSNYEKASVEYISDEGDERLVILKTTSNSEMLTQYRKISFDVIWWNYEGLKVPNEAIYDKQITNELTGEVYATVKAVKLKDAGHEAEVWVKVEKFVDDVSIIENYEDEELIGMGIPESLVEDRDEINMYDEVILN